MSLIAEHCQSIAAGTPALSPEEATALAAQTPQWTLADNALRADFAFKDFREALAFVNQVAIIAEQERHHPDIEISYNKVRLALTTHKIGGLSRNDFIVAAKIDLLR